jgi:hypothetical protein
MLGLLSQAGVGLVPEPDLRPPSLMGPGDCQIFLGRAASGLPADRTGTCATRSGGCRILPSGTPPRSGISGASEWTGLRGGDKTPNLSAEGVLTLAWRLAGSQQAPVLPVRLPLSLSEVHEGVAAFPSPSAEVAAAVPRHPDPAGYFCRISRRRAGARLRS